MNTTFIKYEKIRKYRFVIELLLGAALICLIGIKSGYLYETNDDFIISELLSGDITGGKGQWRLFTHIHPGFGLVMAGLYKIIPSLSWYGLWLILLQLFMYAIPLDAITSRVESIKDWMAVTFIWSVTYLSFWYLHARLQFTSTAELIAILGYLCFAFYYEKKPAFISLCLFEIAALGLRPEGMLMMIPMGMAFVLVKIIAEKKSIRIGREGFKTGLKAASCVIVIVIVGVIILAAAFAPKEQRNLLKENDARSVLFDFKYFPDYEEVEDVLEAKNISKAKYEAYKHYLVLDWDNEEGIMGEIVAANFVDEDNEASAVKILKDSWNAIYANSFGALSTLLIAAWICTIAIIICFKAFYMLWPMAFWQLVRSVCVGYVAYTGRMPGRVILPVLAGEFIFLVSVFFELLLQAENTDLKENKKAVLTKVSVVAAVLVITFFSYKAAQNQYRYVASRKTGEDCLNAQYDQITEYCNSNPDSTFIISNELFSYNSMEALRKPDRTKNFILSGGWHSALPDLVEYNIGYVNKEDTCSILTSAALPEDYLQAELDYLKEYFGTDSVMSDHFTSVTGEEINVYSFAKGAKP